MSVLFANNATSSLAAAITSDATTLTVPDIEAALFPSPTGDDWFPLTLDDYVNIEIMRCTARSGATLTVVRAQEGTAAVDFAAGTIVEHRLTAAILEFLANAGAMTISDSPPPSPVLGQQWFQGSSGRAFVWFVDEDSGQWVQTNLTGIAAPPGTEPPPGGGGGGGDDLQTTPVSAIGSSVEQTVPEWLAGAPIITVGGELFVSNNHRGAWVHLTNAVGTVIYLPEEWLPGWSFGARQIGTGIVSWTPIGGASMQVPFTKISHSTILEQYEEVVFRVISNSDGLHAVWGFSGATA